MPLPYAVFTLFLAAAGSLVFSTLTYSLRDLSRVRLSDYLQKLETASKAVPLDANPATAHLFIVKPFSVSGLAGLFSSHPPTKDRIDALLHARH